MRDQSEMDKKLHKIHQKQIANKKLVNDYVSPGCKKINVIKGVLEKRLKANQMSMTQRHGSISQEGTRASLGNGSAFGNDHSKIGNNLLVRQGMTYSKKHQVWNQSSMDAGSQNLFPTELHPKYYNVNNSGRAQISS